MEEEEESGGAGGSHGTCSRSPQAQGGEGLAFLPNPPKAAMASVELLPHKAAAAGSGCYQQAGSTASLLLQDYEW